MVRSARNGVICVALVLPLALAGCGEESATAQAINDARRELLALHANTVALQDASERESRYENAIRSLQAVSSQGTDSEQASASLLLGSAQSALAQLQATRTFEMEQDAVSALGIIQAKFDHLVVSMQSNAQSMTSFDSTNEQRAIDGDRRELENELGTLSGNVTDLESMIAQWQEELESARSSAAEFRQQEGQFRTQMLQVTGQQRADLTIAAVEAQRSADAFDLKAATASSQISLLEPQLTQLEQEVVRVQTQMSNLTQTRQQMQASDSIRQQAADDAMQVARTASQEISQSLVELDTLLTTDIADAYNQAMSTFDSAHGVLRRASGDAELRTSSSLAMGSVLQSKSEMLSHRISTLRYYATLLGSVADPVYSVPNGSRFADYLGRVNSELAQLEGDLRSTIEEAITTYERVRVSGEAQERLQSLVEQLRESLPQSEPTDS
ncbi:MAG: hypothetical protein ACYTF7_08280 [Planctomycetota bacterium]|jgi:chromosome segregation ATPase